MLGSQVYVDGMELESELWPLNMYLCRCTAVKQQALCIHETQPISLHFLFHFHRVFSKQEVSVRCVAAHSLEMCALHDRYLKSLCHAVLFQTSHVTSWVPLV